jgi:hypothetical protein
MPMAPIALLTQAPEEDPHRQREGAVHMVPPTRVHHLPAGRRNRQCPRFPLTYPTDRMRRAKDTPRNPDLRPRKSPPRLLRFLTGWYSSSNSNSSSSNSNSSNNSTSSIFSSSSSNISSNSSITMMVVDSSRWSTSHKTPNRRYIPLGYVRQFRKSLLHFHRPLHTRKHPCGIP